MTPRSENTSSLYTPLLINVKEQQIIQKTLNRTCCEKTKTTKTEPHEMMMDSSATDK
jgi:hypothetical protein